MSTIPFALSVHKFIDNVGAYVGFASIIAVALLVLLYFAHARETASLRDRLDEAHARIGGLEQRIAQLMQSGRGRPPVPRAPVTTPAPAAAVQPSGSRPAGAVIPSVRRIPTATTPGAATAVAPPPPLVGAAAGRNGLAPAAAAGMAGPALASATTSVPPAVTTPPTATPGPLAAPAGEDTMFVAPATNGDGESSAKSPATVLAAAAPRPTATPKPAAPPPVKIGGTGSSRPRRTAPSSRPLLDDLGSAGEHRRLSGRLLPLLIGSAAVIVIVVGLIVITNSGGGTSTGVVNHSSANSQTGASVTNKKKTTPTAPFVASDYKISVLNGTAVGGLAADVGTVITADKFKLGNVTNAAAQTETSTYVYYVAGKATATNKTAAQHVAVTLKLPSTRVRAAGQSVLSSCATSETGAALGGCKANVIVSVGTDRADLASSPST